MSFAIDTTVLHSLGLSGVKIWSTTQAQSQLSDDVGWMQDLVKKDAAGAMWWTRLWVLHWSLVPKLFCMSRQHHTTSTHVCNDILIELGHFMQYRQERRRISKLLDKCSGQVKCQCNIATGENFMESHSRLQLHIPVVCWAHHSCSALQAEFESIKLVALLISIGRNDKLIVHAISIAHECQFQKKFSKWNSHMQSSHLWISGIKWSALMTAHDNFESSWIRCYDNYIPNSFMEQVQWGLEGKSYVTPSIHQTLLRPYSEEPSSSAVHTDI